MVDHADERWFASYVDRASALVEDIVTTNLRLARQWGDRSLEGGDWTVDTLSGDALEAWEQLTPLAERGIELWLDVVQRALAPGGRGTS